MTPHSRTRAWKILWTEEPGGLQSMGSLRVGHDWATSLSLFTFMHWRRTWQPTPVFLPGESQGRGAWWAAVYGVAQSQTRLKRLSSSSRPCQWGPLVEKWAWRSRDYSSVALLDIWEHVVVLESLRVFTPTELRGICKHHVDALAEQPWNRPPWLMSQCPWALRLLSHRWGNLLEVETSWEAHTPCQGQKEVSPAAAPASLQPWPVSGVCWAWARPAASWT